MIFTSHFLAQVAASDFVKQINEGTLTIDNSSFSTWGSCFTMGLYNGGLKRVSARSRTPLAFGGAVHAGLEAFFRGEADWRDQALAYAAVENLDSMGDPKRNTNKLIDLLEAYTLEYTRMRSMQFDITKIDGKLAVETPFCVPLGETGPVSFGNATTSLRVMWSGKIDILSNYEGAIAPVDHKTTTVMGDKFIDDKIRSSQMLGYTYAARYFSDSLFGGKPVFGARINALAMRSTGFEFKLFDIPYPDWKVAEWQAETLGTIRSLVEQLGRFLATGISLPTREHCVTKYGKCPYYDVCDSIPQMRDRMIFDDSYYYVSDWSPLND